MAFFAADTDTQGRP